MKKSIKQETHTIRVRNAGVNTVSFDLIFNVVDKNLPGKILIHSTNIHGRNIRHTLCISRLPNGAEVDNPTVDK